MNKRYGSVLNKVYAATVLVVDDNEINLIFLEKSLQNHGFQNVIRASSGEEALEKLQSSDADIVVLDIVMGAMDGFECCAKIREMPQYKDLPVLIQTSLTEPEMRVKAFKSGATDFVSKPIFAEELCARVIVHLEKQLLLRSLREYKSRIEEELISARRLQLAILPRADEVGLIEAQCQLSVASHFQPSSEIGGDFWGIRSLFPHQVPIWMVDFSGHGVASALNAFRLQAYMKDFSELASRPGEYLSHLNDKLLNLLLRGQFATMFYGIIDTQTNQLFYACACSPHPMILRGATGRVEMLDGSGSPLGIGLNEYKTQVVPFSTGDSLLLYSDALIETENNNAEFMQEDAIIRTLERNPNASAEHIRDAVLAELHAYAPETPLSDDLTIAVVRRNASA